MPAVPEVSTVNAAAGQPHRVTEGDRIRFTPSAASVAEVRYDGPTIEGVVITADKVQGEGERFRYRIQTDADAPTGSGKIVRTIYSNDGAIERVPAKVATSTADRPERAVSDAVDHHGTGHGPQQGLRLCITHGIRGYFVALMDNEGPIESGFGSYSTPDAALEEAVCWAIEEDNIDLLSPQDRERAESLGYLPESGSGKPRCTQKGMAR